MNDEQARVDVALADLTELNARGEIVSYEVLEPFLDELPYQRKEKFNLRFSDIMELFVLLIANPINYSENEGLWRRLNGISHIITRLGAKG